MDETTIRVLHLIKGLGRGGAETLLLERRRLEEGGEITSAYGYLLPWKDALVEPLRDTGAEVRCFPMESPWKLPRAVLRARGFLRRWEADLLHCHLPVSGVVGRLAGRLAGVPVVYTEHSLHERHHPWTRRLNRLTWRFQDRVVAVSGPVRESILRHAGDGVPVEVIPNGLDASRFTLDADERARTRAALDLDPGQPLVGTVAVFRREKRLDLWLEAASILRRENPECRFLILGDGPLAGELRARSTELGLEGSVSFPGLQEEVRPWLAAMDVFLLSSDWEGLPVAVLEAMAMERPVVATAAGGVPELVTDGETGLLHPRDDAEGLARKAARLISNPALRRCLGRAARRRVEEDFDLARMHERHLRLYRRLLAGRQGEAAP